MNFIFQSVQFSLFFLIFWRSSLYCLFIFSSFCLRVFLVAAEISLKRPSLPSVGRIKYSIISHTCPLLWAFCFFVCFSQEKKTLLRLYNSWYTSNLILFLIELRYFFFAQLARGNSFFSCSMPLVQARLSWDSYLRLLQIYRLQCRQVLNILLVQGILFVWIFGKNDGQDSKTNFKLFLQINFERL